MNIILDLKFINTLKYKNIILNFISSSYLSYIFENLDRINLQIFVTYLDFILISLKESNLIKFFIKYIERIIENDLGQNMDFIIENNFFENTTINFPQYNYIEFENNNIIMRLNNLYQVFFENIINQKYFNKINYIQVLQYFHLFERMNSDKNDKLKKVIIKQFLNSNYFQKKGLSQIFYLFKTYNFSLDITYFNNILKLTMTHPLNLYIKISNLYNIFSQFFNNDYKKERLEQIIDFIKCVKLERLNFYDNDKLLNKFFEFDIKNMDNVINFLKKHIKLNSTINDIINLMNMDNINTEFNKPSKTNLKLLLEKNHYNVLIPRFHGCSIISNDLLEVPKNTILINSSLCGLTVSNKDDNMNKIFDLFFNKKLSYILRDPIKYKEYIQSYINKGISIRWSKLEKSTGVIENTNEDEKYYINHLLKNMTYFKDTNKYSITGFYSLDYYLSKNINHDKPEYFFKNNQNNINKKVIENMFKYSLSPRVEQFKENYNDLSEFNTQFNNIMNNETHFSSFKFTCPSSPGEYIITKSNPEYQTSLKSLLEKNPYTIIYYTVCRNFCCKDDMSEKKKEILNRNRRNSLSIAFSNDSIKKNISIISDFLNSQLPYFQKNFQLTQNMKDILKLLNNEGKIILLYMLLYILELQNIKDTDKYISSIIKYLHSIVKKPITVSNFILNDLYTNKNNDNLFELLLDDKTDKPYDFRYIINYINKNIIN